MATLNECSIDGCQKNVIARGWCHAHYKKWQKYGDPKAGTTNLSRMGVCDVEECNSPIEKKRLCSLHYQRLRNHGTTDDSQLSATERFWLSVDQMEDCWLWTGKLDKTGYGRFRFGGGIDIAAHRYSFQLVYGEIQQGLDIDHECHNRDLTCLGGVCRHRKCVNPEHLRQATRARNIASGVVGRSTHDGEITRKWLPPPKAF